MMFATRIEHAPLVDARQKGCGIESALFKFDYWWASFRLCHVIPLWSLMKRPGISPPAQSA
jgi:hypothetical protein